MDRRTFSKTLAGATFGAAATAVNPARGARSGDSSATANLSEDQAVAETPFKISIMLWTVFNKLPFEERLEKVAEAGYHAVQLTGESAKWTDEEFRQYNKKRTELGIKFDTCAGLRYGAGDPGVRDAFLDDIRAQLPMMEKLDCPSLIVMSGNVVQGLSPQAQHDSCVEGLKRAADLVDAKGITLLLENIDLEENPHYYLWSVPEAFKIIEEVDHPNVKFLYDFYHAQISGGNLITNLQKNAEKVGLIHIADVPGRHEPGTGEIDYVNIYKKLGGLNYNRYVAMEFHPSGDPVKILSHARVEALRAAQG